MRKHTSVCNFGVEVAAKQYVWALDRHERLESVTAVPHARQAKLELESGIPLCVSVPTSSPLSKSGPTGAAKSGMSWPGWADGLTLISRWMIALLCR